MSINPYGPLCRCGKRGCVEAYVSDFSLLAAARRAGDQGRWNLPEHSELTLEDVIAAAKNGEAAIIEIYHRAGRMLGLGLASLIQVFSPQRIIVSGQGVCAGDFMFRSMNQTVKEYCNPEIAASVEIVIQKWRDTDWARGAANLVLQEIYKSPFDRVKPESCES